MGRRRRMWKWKGGSVKGLEKGNQVKDTEMGRRVKDKKDK